MSGTLGRIPFRIRKYTLLIAAGLLIGAVAFKGEGGLERLFIDLRFLLTATFRAQAIESQQIAIIRMDARSADILKAPQGTKWRQFHPALIAALRQAGASLIVFDAMFEGVEKEYDAQLADAFRAAGNVIAGEDIPGTTPALLRSSLLSIGDLRITLMGGIPRFVAIRGDDATGLPPLSVLVAEEQRSRVSGAVAGAWRPEKPGFWINFRDLPGHFRSFSYADVYNAADGRLADQERTPVSFFKDRIVFIGLDDPSSLNDRFPLPTTLGTRYPGVWGHAFATETILLNQPISRTSAVADVAITLGFLLLVALGLEIRARAARGIVLVLLPLAAFAGSEMLLAAFNLWAGYAPVFVGYWVVLILHWISARVFLAANLRRAVGFDPRLIEGFQNESAHAGGPIRKEATLLIADVRGYTSYVSGTDPGVVTRVMTEYMKAMERCITAQGGYINKYVGDEIVAVFGFPLAAEESASRAARAAEAMLRELATLVESWKEQGIASFHKIGIGIDAGHVVFAEVGGRTKSQFDIIGDCINGASRIQTLTKSYRYSLMISEEVYTRIEDKDDICGSFELVGSVPIRGQGSRTLYGYVG